MNLELLKLDITAFQTSVLKVRIKNKEEVPEGKQVNLISKNRYKIEAPTGTTSAKGFAAELEFHNEKMSKVVSFKIKSPMVDDEDSLLEDYDFDQEDTLFEPFTLVIEVLNGT
jgi:hypothetical protein